MNTIRFINKFITDISGIEFFPLRHVFKQKNVLKIWRQKRPSPNRLELNQLEPKRPCLNKCAKTYPTL